jgi:hypothetical protein
VAHGVASGYRGKELLGRICAGTFWGRIYWNCSTHVETLTVALETNGEDCRGAAVAGAHEVATSRSLKFRSRIRGVWLRVAGLDSDALGSEEEEKAYYGWTAPCQLWQAFHELNPASPRTQLQHCLVVRTMQGACSQSMQYAKMGHVGSLLMICRRVSTERHLL